MSFLKNLNSSPLIRVHLIRHGESEANKLGLVCGSLDFALTEHGRQQAILQRTSSLTESLQAFPCFTSTLSRAKETAERLGLKITRAIDELKETDTGSASRLTQESLCLTHPQFKHHATDLDCRYEGGETTGEMLTRSWKAFESLALGIRAPEIVIVAHGGPLNSICTHLLESNFVGFPKFLFDHVRVTTLSRLSQNDEIWRMERMNAAT